MRKPVEVPTTVEIHIFNKDNEEDVCLTHSGYESVRSIPEHEIVRRTGGKNARRYRDSLNRMVRATAMRTLKDSQLVPEGHTKEQRLHKER